MKLNPPNTHRSQIKICEKRQTRNVQFRFMPNAFRILKPIQKSSKCVWVFRNTGANAFAKNQTRLAYEDKRDLYCIISTMVPSLFTGTYWYEGFIPVMQWIISCLWCLVVLETTHHLWNRSRLFPCIMHIYLSSHLSCALTCVGGSICSSSC